MRVRVQKAERQAYWRHIGYLIDIGDLEKDLNPGKQKRFWSFIKSLKKDNCRVASLKETGKMHADLEYKANILNRQYELAFTREDTSYIQKPRVEPCQPMPDIIATVEGVAKLLRRINQNKSCEPNMIPARIFEEFAKEISLTAIFQKSLDVGIVPDDWRSANVSAIFKKWFKASSYHPVLLMSLCCKVQEHIITSNIQKHLQEYDILTYCQHEFRARPSSETQLMTLVHELAEATDRGRQTDMIILDFSKAFYLVPHLRLLEKIYHYGTR